MRAADEPEHEGFQVVLRVVGGEYDGPLLGGKSTKSAITCAAQRGFGVSFRDVREPQALEGDAMGAAVLADDVSVAGNFGRGPLAVVDVDGRELGGVILRSVKKCVADQAARWSPRLPSRLEPRGAGRADGFGSVASAFGGRI